MWPPHPWRGLSCKPSMGTAVYSLVKREPTGKLCAFCRAVLLLRVNPERRGGERRRLAPGRSPVTSPPASPTRPRPRPAQRLRALLAFPGVGRAARRAGSAVRCAFPSLLPPQLPVTLSPVAALSRSLRSAGQRDGDRTVAQGGPEQGLRAPP